MYLEEKIRVLPTGVELIFLMDADAVNVCKLNNTSHKERLKTNILYLKALEDESAFKVCLSPRKVEGVNIFRSQIVIMISVAG